MARRYPVIDPRDATPLDVVRVDDRQTPKGVPLSYFQFGDGATVRYTLTKKGKSVYACLTHTDQPHGCKHTTAAERFDQRYPFTPDDEAPPDG